MGNILQDRYAGDVGDFVKLGLLRALSPGRRLGVAWYRFPDEGHNTDGRHVGYLKRAELRALDPVLLDHLQRVTLAQRSIASLLPVLEGAASFDDGLDMGAVAIPHRRDWRQQWFARVLDRLKDCDIVFADPDNGIVDDDDQRKGRSVFGKQMPLSEVRQLSRGRCAVIYHHNTRRPGGHSAEVDHWLSQIGVPAMAVRANAYSCRTFFILNPDAEIVGRVRQFCEDWRILRVSLHEGQT